MPKQNLKAVAAHMKCLYQSRTWIEMTSLSRTCRYLPKGHYLKEICIWNYFMHEKALMGLEILNVVGPSQADVIEIVDQLLEDSVVASVGNRKHGLFEAIKLRKKRPLQSTTCPQSTCTNRIVTLTKSVLYMHSMAPQQFAVSRFACQVFHTIVHTPTSISHKFLILQSTWPGSHPCNIPRSIQVMTMTCFGGIAVTLLMTSPGPKSCPGKSRMQADPILEIKTLLAVLWRQGHYRWIGSKNASWMDTSGYVSSPGG